MRPPRRSPSRRCARSARPPTPDRSGNAPALTPPIRLSRDALVLLVGIAGSGKTTFAARHFGAHEVLSSDALRALVAGDPRDQAATDDAFAVLDQILDMRLRRGLLTVVDATNAEGWARARLLDAAWRHRRPTTAIVLDLPLAACLERNAARADGPRPAAAVRRQHRWLRQSLPEMREEGYAGLHVLTSATEVDRVLVTRD